MSRAPFVLPYIDPDGYPMTGTPRGAVPSVPMDDDDSNDAHLGEGDDTGEFPIYPETCKGDQE